MHLRYTSNKQPVSTSVTGGEYVTDRTRALTAPTRTCLTVHDMPTDEHRQRICKSAAAETSVLTV